MNDLIRAKVTLYHLLIKKGASSLTSNEIDIMFNLSKDDDVQQILVNKQNENR